MFVDRALLLAVCRSLFVVRCSLFVVYCSLSVVVVWCLLLVGCGSWLFAVCCLYRWCVVDC